MTHRWQISRRRMALECIHAHCLAAGGHARRCLVAGRPTGSHLQQSELLCCSAPPLADAPLQDLQAGRQAWQPPADANEVNQRRVGRQVRIRWALKPSDPCDPCESGFKTSLSQSCLVLSLSTVSDIATKLCVSQAQSQVSSWQTRSAGECA